MEGEDETIFTPSDRAKGSAECSITVPQFLKPPSPLLLWVEIYFMITQEKYLEGSSCTSHSISLSDNGFLQIPTAKLKKKVKVNGCAACTQTAAWSSTLKRCSFIQTKLSMVRRELYTACTNSPN